jgi:rRNA biogenesis protein RRP5
MSVVFLEVTSSDEDEDEEPASQRLTKNQKKRLQRKQEEELEKRENELLNSKDLQSAADYNRALVGAPNNSLLWVQFMSFHIQLAEIEKARSVAEKALKTIIDSELEERLNIWKALLNLEARFGTSASLEKTLLHACQYNDPKVIYLHLVEVFDASKSDEKMFEVFELLCKKFGSSKKVWIRYGSALLSRSKVNEAKELLKRALTRLPKRKHVAAISKFAQLEFKVGDPERGRTIFEEILSSYPKRVDIWSVYLDHELNAGNFTLIRHLFDRIISLNLSSKKMKYFFKRYLEFERLHGDSSSMEYVKQKAREYVERKMH